MYRGNRHDPIPIRVDVYKDNSEIWLPITVGITDGKRPEVFRITECFELFSLIQSQESIFTMLMQEAVDALVGKFALCTLAQRSRHQD